MTRDLPDAAWTTPDRAVTEFARRGLLLLHPERLGVAADLHARLYAREKALHDQRQPVTPASVPEITEVLESPGLIDIVDRLVGPGWAIVPFTHNASFTSGARDQHWHKDDNAPYNSRKQRHHQAVQIEMLYYPQPVTPQMGPTATVPFSHYWFFNHEENHDNFAGADHLDFAYHISGMERQPVSGPDSKYDPQDIVAARTEHDARMRDAVTATGWPLVHQLEAAPLPAGSVLLYSHNTFHRGNHRRDDWRTWDDNPRFMWRFWIYRTSEPAGDDRVDVDGVPLGVDPLTGQDLSAVGDDVTALWRYHDQWMRSGSPPSPRADAATAAQLFAQLHTPGEAAEPQRIGAAYRLAALDDTALAVDTLGRALATERENVRRAATWGLIAVGLAATDTLLDATRAPLKWVRKAGVYGLGDASPLSAPVLDAVVARLRDDDSVYVRAVAAGSLGCLGRRALGTGVGAELVPRCVEELLAAVDREPDRLAMDRVQGRSIKFCRPTDECDVCEGGGIDFGHERFAPVRSTVRENAMWSLVILCSHGGPALGDALEPLIVRLSDLIRHDRNVFCVGHAMDALARLARPGADGDGDAELPALQTLRRDLVEILRSSPVRCWESLVRSGLGVDAIARVEGDGR